MQVDAALFDDIVQGSRVPVLVDFWAEWCGPCHAAAPEVARTAKDMAGKALVLKVDTDKNQQLAARFNVRGIPNFAVFSAGKLVKQQAGWSGTMSWKAGFVRPRPHLQLEWSCYQSRLWCGMRPQSPSVR